MKEENLIFKAIVGSQSYGTSTASSDIDYKGVYMQSVDELISFGYKDQYEVTKDEVYYELRRFVDLLSSAKPTVLELLYSPEDCIVKSSPEFELLRSHRDKFLTKKCLMSFGSYAVAQIKKARGLDKKMNYEKDRMTRKDVLDFCYVLDGDNNGSISFKEYLKREKRSQEHFGLSKLNHFRDCYLMFYDHLAEMKSSNPKFSGSGYGFRGVVYEDSNDVHLSDIPIYAVREGVLYFNKDGYSMHCKDYNDYEVWLKNRSVSRFVDVKGHGQQIDGKNMLHCRRLLDMAMEIARDGVINVRRPNADYLLSIRKGKVKLEDIIDQAEEDLKGLDLLFANSGLPDDCDREFSNKLLLDIRHLRG
jgi:hypothetical protein